jgi:hypothetical protein
MVTFAAKAVDSTQPGGVWVDGDTVGVLIKKTDSHYKVWTAIWDATNEHLEVVTEEDTVGTISDGDTVLVLGILTAEVVDNLVMSAQLLTVSGTTHTTALADKGKVVRCTSGSAVTITLDDAMPVGYHGLVVQEGAGAVSLARDGTDTINGGTANVMLGGQWKSAYFYQPTNGAWVVVV